MKNIKATKAGIGFYDDGSSLKELKDSFQSSVYASLDEFMDDLSWMSKNENFHMELAHVTESNKSRRSLDERQSILIKKVNAKRRYDEHHANGGTEYKWASHSEMNNKKASH